MVEFSLPIGELKDGQINEIEFEKWVFSLPIGELKVIGS